MENRKPIPLKRKLILGALAGGVGLSLAAIIVSFAVNALTSPQSTQYPATPELARDVESTRPIVPSPDDPTRETYQSSVETLESPLVVEGD